ncbi:unnamed protein product [Parnassius mnemosyne]|uniref:Uncharacterized protein n=1 Tax=Parnassius mnemosyne TaxID=213953 RepID=A0AAV1M1K7_9NEOP
MVERMHRHLKAAIVCHNNQRWTESLPLVLLGMRNALKQDLQASPAELLYGESLRLPGEFLHSNNSESSTDITDFLSRLRLIMNNIRPSPGTRHGSKKVFIFKDLPNATHVYVRDDSVKGSLQPAYSGPFKVLERGDKIYKLLMKGKEQTVSIDRIKPAYIPSDASTCRTPPAKKKEEYEKSCTRSGRRVKLPDYYRPS